MYASIQLHLLACPAAGNHLIIARLQQLGLAGSEDDFIKLSGHLIYISTEFSGGRKHRAHRWRNEIYNPLKLMRFSGYPYDDRFEWKIHQQLTLGFLTH